MIKITKDWNKISLLSNLEKYIEIKSRKFRGERKRYGGTKNRMFLCKFSNQFCINYSHDSFPCLNPNWSIYILKGIQKERGDRERRRRRPRDKSLSFNFFTQKRPSSFYLGPASSRSNH